MSYRTQAAPVQVAIALSVFVIAVIVAAGGSLAVLASPSRLVSFVRGR